MKRISLLLLFTFTLMNSCSKEHATPQGNATIISFNPEKCGCCWGWTIVKGSDTLKSDDELIAEVIGYEITKPIAVNIEIGDLKQHCAGSGNKRFDYFEVKSISKAN